MQVHSHEMTLGIAFFLGALHALEPGHGKTAMLIYISERRRSLWHPIVMGVSSALAHSASLLVIASLVHLAQHVVTGDHQHDNGNVSQSLQWISAILILCVGAWMLRSAIRQKPQTCGCQSHRREACESRTGQVATSYSMSALLGIAFGLLPCPSAMAAYFAGMSSGTPVAAYAVIALFAAGIAVSLSIVGMALQGFGEKWFRGSVRLQALPWSYVRATLILGIGVFYTARLMAFPS